MRHIYRHRRLKAVLVTLDNGDAFRGVLFDIDADAVVLRNAAQFHPSNDSDKQFVVADGEIVIPAGRVAYMNFV